MRFFFNYILAGLATVFMCSCDDHEYIDTSVRPGYILTADGRMMSEDDYFSQDVTRAVGVVFSGRLDDGRYLAVLLSEGSQLQFADSIPYRQGTSCSMTAYDGFGNTTALQNARDYKTHHGSPLADAVFAVHIFGQSDFIPSVAEWRLLYASREAVNATIISLVNHGESASLLDFSGGEGCWYWTSTEVEGNDTNQAWLFSLSSGVVHETPKIEWHRYRAVISVHPFE